MKKTYQNNYQSKDERQHNEVLNMKIDYECFTTNEITAIFNFYNLITLYVTEHKGKVETLIDAYHVYKDVLNSMAFEKRYNSMFEKQTGIKIYQTMRDIENKKK